MVIVESVVLCVNVVRVMSLSVSCSLFCLIDQLVSFFSCALLDDVINGHLPSSFTLFCAHSLVM